MPDDAAAFGAGRATFSRRHHSLHSTLDVAVASKVPVAKLEQCQAEQSEHALRAVQK